MFDTKSLKGRSNDAVCSACMYIACRQEGVPRTLKGRNQSNTLFKQVFVTWSLKMQCVPLVCTLLADKKGYQEH